MSSSTKVLEPAFQGVGQKVGIEIWRIEDLKPVPLPKSDYGKFYTGDSYIVLQTTGKAGAYMYDIHFWLGKDTSQDEAGTAAVKTVELDAILGGRAVQYRELQGHESDKFLSYFRPCIIPLEGGFASGFKTPDEEEFETRLYTCKGKRVVRLKQVPFCRSSLNHDEVFILDTNDKIFQFNGANTNIQERAKALEVMQYLKDKYHKETCKVAIVDDGKLQAEGDSGEFWVFLGGFAPIGKKIASEDDITPERTPAKLYCINGSQLHDVDGDLSKSLLQSDKCYILYCGIEVFLWVGRTALVKDKKAAMQAVEDFIADQNLPKSIRVTRLAQGHETHSFRSNFDSWPLVSAASAPPEETRGKVAALLKQQGGALKAQPKSSPVNEEVPPLLGENGKIEVWRIDGSAKTPVPSEDIGKFYSGDCYICLYSYHSSDKKDEHYVCYWIGKDSIEDDRNMACQLTTTMFNSLKGKPVQGRVYQGKEAPQFIAIFQPMVVLKGGLSSGYKNYLAENEINDETYSPDTVALIEIYGTSVHNNKAFQVNAVATSLNSYECFVLQSGSAVFAWHGNQSPVEQQQLAAKISEFLKPGVPVKFVKEGTENTTFWSALGGKQVYTSKKVAHAIVREPHLFASSFIKGKFEIEEVYSFAQDDLLSEDIMILDTHAEVFLWVGHLVEPKEKQNAFEIGQKYVDLAASLDGLSPYVPLYKVMEGSEPYFFTTYFSWDPAKTNVHENSFQKKAMQLFGIGHATESHDKPHGSHGGPTQRASALAALNNAFKATPTTKAPTSPRAHSQGSQRAAAVAALSAVLTAEKKESHHPHDLSPRRHNRERKSHDLSPIQHNKSPQSESKTEKISHDLSPIQHNKTPPSEPVSPVPIKTEEPAEVVETNEGSEVTTETTTPVLETNDSPIKETTDGIEHECEEDQPTYSYDQLRAKSENPVTGIDFKKREAYLSTEEFEDIFKMTKEAFYKFPRWKQDLFKKKVDLF